jgi:2-polyprenyl-3-methyl-5-hydroxy-6-metoxy-1,4-benzoquinol methylase
MTAVDYTEIYDPDTDFDARFTLATGRAIAARLAPGQRVLELGCATGLMTTLLAGDDRAVVGVDRSRSYLARAAARALPGVTLVAADLTDLPADLGAFDHVVAANVLHELPDPQALLARVADRHLAPGGRVHVSLQNPRSLHRLVALEMGLIDDLCAVAARGERFGTLRLYEADELSRMVCGAGMREVARQGVFLKPLTNAAMEALPSDVLDGFERAARHLPEHGAMNLLTFAHAG